MNSSLADTFSDGISRGQAIPDSVSRRKRLSLCVAAALVGVSLASIHDVNAAPKKSAKKSQSSKAVSELEAENALLKAQLEAVQHERDSLKQAGAGGAASAVGEPSLAEPTAETTEPAETVAEKQAAETDNLGEIVVKGKKKAKLAQLKETYVSASVVGGDELKSQQANDLGSILQRTGNVKWNTGNSRTAGLTMRGIGNVAVTDAMDTSVGMVVDDVPYSYGPMNSFDQFDVDTVEVDRGPQGTAGGKNFSVGQVNVKNKRPTFTNEANGSVAYGSYNTVIADVAAGGAVVDGLLAWRGAAHVNKGDGAVSNTYNSQQTWYNRDRTAGRFQLLLTPAETFSAHFSFDIQPSSSEFFNGNSFYTPTPKRYANGSVNPLSTDASTRLARSWFKNADPSYSYQNNYLYGGSNHQFNMDAQYPLVASSKGGYAALDWQLDQYKLSSITSVRDYDFQASNDSEGTPFDISKGGGGSIHKFSQISEELKVSSSIGKLVDYQTGVYLMERKMVRGSATGFGSDAGAWFASNAQYGRLNADASGQRLMSNSLNGLSTQNPYNIDNKTAAIFGEAKWHITEPLTVATGLRGSYENRENPTSKYITNQGNGAALNPVSINGVQTNGFDSNSTTGALTATNSAAQIALANSVAAEYFGAGKCYQTGVGGCASGLTETQQAQVATAKALRRTNIGALWNPEPGESYEGFQPTFNVSPSYKFNEQWTAYTGWRYTQKAGFSQTINGVASQIKPEINSTYEVGFKSSLFQDDLLFNASAFYSNITDYQQGTSILDKYTTDLARLSNPSAPPTFIAASGNAPGVRAFGLEIDGAFRGIPYTSIRFAGAYNNASYTKFNNNAVPLELGYSGGPAYQDVSGKTLPGAARFTFNVGPEFRAPLQLFGLDVFGNPEFHANFNTAFTSAYRNDPLLSNYSWIGPTSYTDLSVGLGRRDKLIDVSFVARNVFNNQTPQAITWNSYTLGIPQWFGFTVSSKL
ncbi:MAG: TonB-dependent receptor [Methylococcales bacterium]|nr:TonB-dependent receptor [Methylococcales bacterium]